MRKIAGKNDVCKEHLLSEIAVGIYRPGERLPAERELSEAYRVSRNTVRTALIELEAAGIVYRRPPVGTFVSQEALRLIADTSPSASRLRALFVLPTGQIDNPFLQRLFFSLKNRLPEGIELTAYLSDSCRGIRNGEGEKPDILYLFGNYPEEELLEAAAETPHAILWGRPHETLNFVTCDEYAGGRLMAEAALRAGHRRLALIGPRGTGPDCEFSLRASGIADVCREQDVPIQVHRMSLEETMSLTSSTFFTLENLFRRDPGLTAILTLSDREAIAVLDCCRRRNLSVPDDISVIGCDDQCFVSSIRPALTTIRCSAEEIGLQLAGFAEAVLAAKPGETVDFREIITPFLVERQSVRSL